MNQGTSSLPATVHSAAASVAAFCATWPPHAPAPVVALDTASGLIFQHATAAIVVAVVLIAANRNLFGAFSSLTRIAFSSSWVKFASFFTAPVTALLCPSSLDALPSATPA